MHIHCRNADERAIITWIVLSGLASNDTKFSASKWECLVPQVIIDIKFSQFKIKS